MKEKNELKNEYIAGLLDTDGAVQVSIINRKDCRLLAIQPVVSIIQKDIYVAGALDGDGCISLHIKNEPGKRLNCEPEIGMKLYNSHDLMRMLKNKYGGGSVESSGLR